MAEDKILRERCAFSIKNDIRILTIQRLQIKPKQRDLVHKMFINIVNVLPKNIVKFISKRDRPL